MKQSKEYFAGMSDSLLKRYMNLRYFHLFAESLY